jgi:hypothetical protein
MKIELYTEKKSAICTIQLKILLLLLSLYILVLCVLSSIYLQCTCDRTYKTVFLFFKYFFYKLLYFR